MTDSDLIERLRADAGTPDRLDHEADALLRDQEECHEK